MATADLGDVSLHYRAGGEGPPVLGIIGFGIDQRFWAAQTPAVTAGNRFITLDHRGVGGSTGELARSMDVLADDALRLLDFLGIESAVVFGVSMGGCVAQRIALDHPERVRALILGMSWARPIEYIRREQEVMRMIVQSAGPDALIEGTLLHLFTPEFFEVGAETIDRWVRALLAETGPGLVSADVLQGQSDAMQKHDVLAELHRITCPTLVFGGKRDMMVPLFATREIADAIPNAEFEVFDAGHALMIEEMDVVNARLRAFLDKLDLEPSSG